MEDSEIVIVSGGDGFGEAISSSPSSKSSSVISLPNPTRPRVPYPVDVTPSTSLKADSLANAGDNNIVEREGLMSRRRSAQSCTFRRAYRSQTIQKANFYTRR